MAEKRVILFLAVILFLFTVACGAANDKDHRDNFDIHDNISDIFAVDALTVVWKLEDTLVYEEEINNDDLLYFTDQYLLDEEAHEELENEEQNLVMKTSGMISKYMRGEYDEDLERFEKDFNDFHYVLETGEYE